MSSGNRSFVCMFLLCVLGHLVGLAQGLSTRCNLPIICKRMLGSVFTITLLVVTVTWLTEPINPETRADRVCVTLTGNRNSDNPIHELGDPGIGINMGGEIKILSFNAQGLQTNRKRKKVMHWLKKKKANVYLLQETHTTAGDEITWREDWGSKVLFSHGNTESRGVAICFLKDFDYTIKKTIRDGEGRYIILDMEINSTRTVIANIYAPNSDEVSFFNKVIEEISALDCVNVIWGGTLILCSVQNGIKPGGSQPRTLSTEIEFWTGWLNLIR